MKDKTYYIDNNENWIEYKKDLVKINDFIKLQPDFKSFEIKLSTGKRSGGQLKSYWVLKHS